MREQQCSVHAVAERRAEALQVELATAIRMASLNPARAMGLDHDTGAINPGLRADLALLNSDGRVVRTWISGVGSA